jgi:hypothetical protein
MRLLFGSVGGEEKLYAGVGIAHAFGASEAKWSAAVSVARAEFGAARYEEVHGFFAAPVNGVVEGSAALRVGEVGVAAFVEESCEEVEVFLH